MELIQEDLLNTICEKCSLLWQMNVFMDHIIISLPGNEEDFRSAYSMAKQEITARVKQYFPERNSDVLFEVRNGSWNCSFKLRRTIL